MTTRRPLRVCMVTTFYPPYSFGGDGIAVRHLARALVRRGHHVTVVHDTDAYRVLSGGEPPSAPPEADDGVAVVRLRTRVPRLSSLLTQQTGHPALKARAIGRVLAAGVDVIHYHNVSLVGGPGVLAYGDAIKLYTAHEYWLVCPTHTLWRHGREACDRRECLRCVLRQRRPPQLWRHTGLLERRLARVDAVIAPSEFARRKHREFGLAREMEVLPAFLPDRGDAPAASAPHPRPYVLYVGRLERSKGLHDVIPLFADRSAAGGADLLVVGDGAQAPALRHLAAGNPRVRFLGRLAPDRCEAYYAHASAVVVPSAGFETFGLVILEAFRHGTPVVARRIGPFPELVAESGGGVLFDTPAELDAALSSLVRDPARRDSLGRAGAAAFSAHWSESAVVPHYLTLIGRLAAARGRPDLARAAEPAPDDWERRADAPAAGVAGGELPVAVWPADERCARS